MKDSLFIALVLILLLIFISCKEEKEPEIEIEDEYHSSVTTIITKIPPLTKEEENRLDKYKEIFLQNVDIFGGIDYSNVFEVQIEYETARKIAETAFRESRAEAFDEYDIVEFIYLNRASEFWVIGVWSFSEHMPEDGIIVAVRKSTMEIFDIKTFE